MLDRFLIDIREVILIGVIMVDVSNSREIKSRDRILDDAEISVGRHEAVNYRGKGVGVRILCTRCIKILDLVITRTCLEKKSRSFRASCLNIENKSYIIKDLLIVIPGSFHAHHANFLGIGKENLHTLFPVLTVLQRK